MPGDLVVLSAGDMIPADCRVLSAQDLFVGQAAMTGESRAGGEVRRMRASADTADPLEQDNLVFMGTNVVSGSATALVVATGSRTYFGTLALASVTACDPGAQRVPGGRQQRQLAADPLRLVMVPIVLLVNGFTKGDWLRRCCSRCRWRWA